VVLGGIAALNMMEQTLDLVVLGRTFGLQALIFVAGVYGLQPTMQAVKRAPTALLSLLR
jgi:hypothetical protein